MESACAVDILSVCLVTCTVSIWWWFKHKSKFKSAFKILKEFSITEEEEKTESKVFCISHIPEALGIYFVPKLG